MARHNQDKGSKAQVQEVPELVELLKRLAAHRLAHWERTYGRRELANTLSRTVAEFRGALEEDDWDGASSLLCRFVQEAGVKCSAEAREAMLNRLKGFMGARLATLASGDKTFNPPFAELGPEAERAFSLGSQLANEIDSQAAREARDAYWQHPLVWLCRRLEERLGIDRHELETAAGRLNSTLGLRGMGPLLAPDGTVGDKGQPDWLWMLPRFKELDRDGTTARLWEKLRSDYSPELQEAGLLPGETTPPPGDQSNRETRHKKSGNRGTRRGRPVDPNTIRRADFAKPLCEQGKTWREIFDLYSKKHPRDMDAAPDTLRLAFERQYPEPPAGREKTQEK